MPTQGEPQPTFLPMTRAEMARLGWQELDVLLVTGDAYVDHPAFGAALLGRWLVHHGYRVGIVAQPRWDTADDVARLGRPRLFAGVTAGALDSMLAHYTAFRKKRHDDAYTPGGRAGARPNRATIVYANLVLRAFSGLPVVIGGIEASMRRASHYDFWTDKLRRSILLDSKADLLICGMAERAILEVAERLRDAAACRVPRAACPEEALRGVRGTAVALSDRPDPTDPTDRSDRPVWTLPSHEEIAAEPKKLMAATLLLERQVHDGSAWATQAAGNRTVVFAPPAEPLTTEELDALYALPFTRRPHPLYGSGEGPGERQGSPQGYTLPLPPPSEREGGRGPIPAWEGGRGPIPAAEMVQFSLTTHRGCAGGCSFCALALHQGRRIRSRSRQSILDEAGRLTRHPDWKGSLSDAGGPTANLWGARCTAEKGTFYFSAAEKLNVPFSACHRASCLHPSICGHFKVDQAALADLLRSIARLPGVKHVRTASGVRHDVAMLDEGYVRALVGEFTGGQLKLAPEHSCDRVLWLMRKPAFAAFERFLTVFERLSREAGKEQYVVPYLLSAFPGCTDADMRALAAWLRRRGWRPQQVQCFIPTPGTVATAMFYAGIDPEGNPIPVARTDAERMRQHYILAPAKRESRRVTRDA